MARQLIVVSREEVALYHALYTDWVGDPHVAVVLDRRRDQRRHESTAVALERRREDRRQHAPLETHLAWRGGGAGARRADVLSVLSREAVSIVVRQRPGAKAVARAPLATPAGDVRDDAFDTSPMPSVPANAVVALVILIGTLSGGIVGGLALWLFLAYEFTSRRGRQGSLTTLGPGAFTWWLRPLHKLRSSRRSEVPVDKAGKA
jgi:hypothetical protein